MAAGPFRRGLMITFSVLIALGVAFGYRYVLETQLAGYSARKQHDLEQIKRRDARRRFTPGIPAERERILREQFGDLPEFIEVRTELELVNTWKILMVLLFAPISVGVALYLNLARKRKPLWRWLNGLAVLLASLQALPLLLLPEDALHFVRLLGVPLVVLGAAVLAVGALRERIVALREKAPA